MVWFKFETDFDFTPAADHRISVAYKSGMSVNVTRECAAAAEAVKAGKRTSKPKGEQAEPEADGADS